MTKQNFKIILILSFFMGNSLFSSAPRLSPRSDASVAGDSLGYSADTSSPESDLSDSEVLMASLAINSEIAKKIGDELYRGGQPIQVCKELQSVIEADTEVLKKLREMEEIRRKEIADYLAATDGDTEGELTPFNTPVARSKSK